ncbi:MAG: hypothetical protein QN122_03375 [Armatimonadota bacterium]|nr:hypothetical protein [Armatimonadota bacterium]MDR7490480.1 hypothetical protein [Armatimonadota bacterium]
MVGIGFLAFLTLLGIGTVVVAAKIVIGAAPGGPRSAAEVATDLVFGWVGGWLGSPVFGHWFENVRYQEIYIFPALLGAVAAVLLKHWYDRRVIPA